MLESPRGRFGALAVLLVVLSVLLVWHGSVGPEPALGDYPDKEDFGPDPDPYVGQLVVVDGEVVSVDPLRIEVEYDADERAVYRVTGYDDPVKRGELLRAFGRLTGARTVDARRGFTVPDRGLFYAWGISFLAGLWTLARIVRHWRLDRGTLALVPREGPLRLPLLGERANREGATGPAGTGDEGTEGSGGDDGA